MYEIKILWSTGLEKSLIVPYFDFSENGKIFWVLEELASGEQQKKYYPLNSIFEITIISRSEEK